MDMPGFKLIPWMLHMEKKKKIRERSPSMGIDLN
jgi:hypothetical protein